MASTAHDWTLPAAPRDQAEMPSATVLEGYILRSQP